MLSRTARGWNSNISPSTRDASGSPHGMSTQTKPSSRASSSLRFSTGCSSKPSSVMCRTSTSTSLRRGSGLGYRPDRGDPSVDDRQQVDHEDLDRPPVADAGDGEHDGHPIALVDPLEYG